MFYFFQSSKKQKGGMSFGLINADGDEGPFVSPAGAVMVRKLLPFSYITCGNTSGTHR